MSSDPEPRIERVDARVTGRVHGVGFRYFVVREAQGLGLVGWVANVMDGSVRCVAEGPRHRLDELVARLSEGPPAAIVDNVSVAWMPATGTFTAFGVRSGAHSGD
jgi:acylphosphatase